jgi:leucyl-tRNA---protein transferase
MLVETMPIDIVTKKSYDKLLSRGWFRGTGLIYRTELLCLDGNVFAVRHIRLPMDDFKPTQKQHKILRRCESRFRIEIGQPCITDEKEELYIKHTSKFKAFVHQALSDFLHEYADNPEVNTQEMAVYDGNRIVALSYFDVGEKSMASLMCIYDDEYARFSLGHFTMLREIKYGISRGVKYFYPGYVLDMPSSFDYKLTLGSLEWLNGSNKWVKQEDYVRPQTLGDVVRDKMKEVKVLLSMRGLDSKFQLYPYFSLSYVMPNKPHLLDLPCYYLFHFQSKDYAAGYDVVKKQIVAMEVDEADEMFFNQGMTLSEEYQHSDNYELRVMKKIDPMNWEKFKATVIDATPEIKVDRKFELSK